MDVELPGLAIALIIFQASDAIACAIPLRFITRALNIVEFPPEYRWLLPVVKAAAAVGLAIGLWVPTVGLLTIAALIAYFIIAIGAHIRVRDTVQNSAGAVVMLGVVAVVGALSYLPAV